jgi:hypothetical protein
VYLEVKTMDSSNSISVFAIIFVSLIFCCITISCCGYILSQKLYTRQQQIHCINHPYASEAHSHVFTVDMPCTQLSNNEQSSSYLSDKPPSYQETVVTSASGN